MENNGYMQVKQLLDLTYRQKIVAGVLLGLLLAGGAVFLVTDPLRKAVEYREELPSKQMVAHVCGAVAKPGVVRIPVGSRVFEALKKVGGALPEADLDQVNLAAFVEDGEQIYLPKKGEVMPVPVYKAKSGKGSASKLRFAKNQPKSAKSKTAAAQPKLKVTWPLDLNQATREQLILVPGIGPVMADKILAYRQAFGNFASYEDLNKVNGIGPSKLEKFRPFLCVK